MRVYAVSYDCCPTSQAAQRDTATPTPRKHPFLNVTLQLSRVLIIPSTRPLDSTGWARARECTSERLRFSIRYPDVHARCVHGYVPEELGWTGNSL